MITDVHGVRLGHWTDESARTGCTVVLFPEGSLASGEVRGGAPATREFDLLDPSRTVERLDAVVLSGGSAFGLAASIGVVEELEARGVGYDTPGGRVPIVVGMCLYDLFVGDGHVRPGAPEGRAAVLAATAGRVALGPVGAGTGCTYNKWQGREHAMRGGLGSATVCSGEIVVSALVAVNAYGGLDDGVLRAWPPPDPAVSFTNTTIGVIATNAKLDKMGCHLVAQSGHDGLARALVPVHTRADGDALVAVSCGAVDARLDEVRMLAVRAVEQATRAGCLGVPNPLPPPPAPPAPPP